MSPSVIAASTRNGFALGLAAGLIIASGFFLLHGPITASGPERSAGTAPSAAATSVAMPVATTAATPQARAGSMEAAALALKTRLAAQGGADDQWQLLAQSYDFLGRSADARLAREHKVPGDDGLGDAVALSTMLLKSPGADPAATASSRAIAADADRLMASAEQHRRQRDFTAACADYARLVRLGAMTADAWADYADAQGSLQGGLAGAPAKAIEQALAMNPKHTKALWLKASLEHEEHRYKDAVVTWRTLLPLVPAGSSDARIVQANIAEAMRLSAG